MNKNLLYVQEKMNSLNSFVSVQQDGICDLAIQYRRAYAQGIGWALDKKLSGNWVEKTYQPRRPRMTMTEKAAKFAIAAETFVAARVEKTHYRRYNTWRNAVKVAEDATAAWRSTGAKKAGYKANRLKEVAGGFFKKLHGSIATVQKAMAAAKATAAEYAALVSAKVSSTRKSFMRALKALTGIVDTRYLSREEVARAFALAAVMGYAVEDDVVAAVCNLFPISFGGAQ